MTELTIFFEDLVIGRPESFGARFVSREEVIEFAGKYDPQPFHLDDAAAADGEDWTVRCNRAAFDSPSARVTIVRLATSIVIASKTSGPDISELNSTSARNSRTRRKSRSGKSGGFVSTRPCTAIVPAKGLAARLWIDTSKPVRWRTCAAANTGRNSIHASAAHAPTTTRNTSSLKRMPPRTGFAGRRPRCAAVLT